MKKYSSVWLGLFLFVLAITMSANVMLGADQAGDKGVDKLVFCTGDGAAILTDYINEDVVSNRGGHIIKPFKAVSISVDSSDGGELCVLLVK